MNELRKHPRAERDLREIWRYTNATWSARQADTYLRKLDRAMRRAARTPGHGQAVPELGPGLHKLAVERHRIFYRVGSDVVVIIRVLHDQMDFVRHVEQDDD